MEFRYGEESKSWSEEESDDRAENNEERASGRSYECVFCKRGFTTAQALGGHMNIHRKDRANKSTKSSYAASSSAKLIVEDHAISSFPPPNYFSPEVVDHNNNSNYLPSQFSLPSSVQYSDHQRDRDGFGGDYNWSTGLNLSNPLYPPHNNNKGNLGSSSEEDGLDLELRLGYHS